MHIPCLIILHAILWSCLIFAMDAWSIIWPVLIHSKYKTMCVFGFFDNLLLEFIFEAISNWFPASFYKLHFTKIILIPINLCMKLDQHILSKESTNLKFFLKFSLFIKVNYYEYQTETNDYVTCLSRDNHMFETCDALVPITRDSLVFKNTSIKTNFYEITYTKHLILFIRKHKSNAKCHILSCILTYSRLYDTW